MSIVDRADLSRRRARAGRIREGMKSYISTLGEIAAAYAERDWEVLGYDGWDAYVDEEFGADRLRLTPEHRAKAVQELRLAGLSQRAIGSALNVSKATVERDLSRGSNEPPAEVRGIDGKTYQTPARRDLEPNPPGPAVATPGESAEPEGVAVSETDAAVISSTEPEGVAPEAEGTSGAASSAEPPAGPSAVAVHSDRPGLEEFVNDDPAVQASSYMAAFGKELSRAGAFLGFDAERIADLASPTTWDAIEAHASVVEHWFETARKARTGLRVIRGGVA